MIASIIITVDAANPVEDAHADLLSMMTRSNLMTTSIVDSPAETTQRCRRKADLRQRSLSVSSRWRSILTLRLESLLKGVGDDCNDL
jgi:hypothetical protein